jgi:excisionase family DNA binding protein
MTKRLDVLTAAEVADELRISVGSVRKMAQKGDLIGRKVGDEWRFLLADVEAFARGERLAA